MILRREISFIEAMSYGVGVILGAGIYALVGKAAAEAGSAVWLSFLIGTLIAATTGLAYAELASMYPKTAAEYVYVFEAYRRDWLAFLTGWSMLFSQILAAATVSLGFAGYFQGLVSAPGPLIAILLVLVLTILITRGAKESVRLATLFMLIEAAGLLLVVAIGISAVPTIKFLDAPNGANGILAGSTLVFFAFIGFQNIANLSEEAVNPQKIIPKAIIFSILVCAVLYILVSVSAVGLVGTERLAASTAPLADAVAARFGTQSYLALSLVALFATSNTVLAALLTASRIFYGMSRERVLPQHLGRLVTRYSAPLAAIAATGLVSAVLITVGDIKRLANMTSLGALFAFGFVNASLIRLRRTQPTLERPFKVPISLGFVPLPSLIAIVSCVVLLTQFDVMDVLLGSPFILMGFLLHLLSKKREQAR